MADAMAVLRQRAKEYALQLNAKDSQLQQELLELKRQVLAKEREIKFAGEATKRFLDFSPSLAGVVQCPCCWILWQVRTDLHTVRGTADADEFACSACGSSFTVEI